MDELQDGLHDEEGSPGDPDDFSHEMESAEEDPAQRRQALREESAALLQEART